ncbi:MAG: hypothetical protein ABI867_21215 [Kofleriaceae bacterium]
MSAVVRWDGFLAQIQGRHRQVIEEAEAAARQFIAGVAGGGDVTPLSNQLSAAKSRLQALQQNIVDTWHGKVEDVMLEEGHVPLRDAEWKKGEAVRHRLDDETEELEIRMLAELARARFAAAQATIQPPRCGTCGTVLAGPPSFRHVELACACGARTTIAPNELLSTAAAIATHPISQEAATAEWRAMRHAERAQKAVRPPSPLALIVAYERTQIMYWHTYLATRAQFEPELGRDPNMEIRSRMEQWYVSYAEYEEEWVRAGRPRSI